MSDLKILIYKDNRPPRGLSFSTKETVRVMALIGVASFLILGLLGAGTYLTLKNRKLSAQLYGVRSENLTGSPQEIGENSLQDQVEQLESKLKNQISLQNTPKQLEKTNPVLALFSPLVTDKTQNQDRLSLKNIHLTPAHAKLPATLTFELHNLKDAASAQKGYIVVLMRAQDQVKAYPQVFNTSGAYLLDFEKGETFNVQRFRYVNVPVKELQEKMLFQILIFTRQGEVLINQSTEAASASS